MSGELAEKGYMKKDNSNTTNFHNDLRKFLELLENENEIIRIKKNVNTTFELPSSLLTIAGNSNVVLTFFLILMISFSFSSNSKNFLRSL